MKLDPKVVERLAVSFEPRRYLRVTPRVHARTPLGMGFGASRFASPNRSFRLIYVTRDLATGIAETIVRDRFEDQELRQLDASEVEPWSVVDISATRPLTVLDLRTTGLLQLGVSTDAARAKGQEQGRLLSQALYDGFDVDGLLYSSRLTGANCVALYDRCVHTAIAVAKTVDLVRMDELISALAELNVSMIRGP